MPIPYRRSTDDAWRRLRTLRRQPPGFAKTGDRAGLFASALEQSEQFFRAADAVGYETKPVMLYYGLSQAVQAILVAKRNPKISQRPATSHGTDCPNRDQTKNVGDVEIIATPGQAGAFGLLADTLGSPSLPGPVALRQMWISLPEGVQLPPSGADELFGAALLERHDNRNYGDAFQNTTARVAKLAHLPYALMPLDVAEVERQVVERYPALRNFHVIADTRECPEVAHWVLLLDPPSLRASLSFHRQDRRMEHSEVFGMSEMGPRAYAHPEGPSLWLPPALPGSTAPLHPLNTWYAVLFALSELARYRPLTWARAIAVDTSRDASALEHLMDGAHLACINLVAELFDVRSPTGHAEPEGRRLHGERVREWMRAQRPPA
jgi:hypothetical protein